MEINQLTVENIPKAARLAAEFRVALKSYKGIAALSDIDSGKEELAEYLQAGYPVFVAQESGINCGKAEDGGNSRSGGGRYLGYLVCRIDEPCVWVESIYVAGDCRRKGIASALFVKAEELAASFGEETVYNYVHPNNEGMIRFLKSRGYNVLNLIEIRKPFAGEKPQTKIKVGNEEFDY